MTTILDVPDSKPTNPYSAPVQAVLTSAQISKETVAHIVDTITASPRPARALWELWDAFFTAVVNSTSYIPHLAFLDSIRAYPPTQPKNTVAGCNDEIQLRSYVHSDGKLHWSSLPRFSTQWHDTHDVLEAWRDWDGVRTSGERLSASGGEYFLRFCEFSAALLKTKEREVHPVNVFYACKNVLERQGPEPRLPKPRRVPAEQSWALDVRVTATWLRDGGFVLWEMDQEELARGWSASLAEETDLWQKEDGLTCERWRLWVDRLRALSADESFDDATRKVITEAAHVVAELLKR